jgi:tRNA G18 (ribose-2'-O)-methylase SpoU
VFLGLGIVRAGLTAAILERSNVVVGIPMYGVNHSFPVAVAAGIVMSDWARRRYAAGTTIVGPSQREER